MRDGGLRFPSAASFEVAVAPCRVVCCGSIFCMNHISDVSVLAPFSCSTDLFLRQWLYGSSSDGRCPSCKEFCSFVQEMPPTRPVDTTHVQACPLKPERYILLLLQPSESKFPSSPIASSDAITRSNSLNSLKPPAAPITMANTDWSRDSYILPCRFHLNSTLVVLVGRMVGRVLSVVGLTLVLFVLLT
jgi:hypothetical protein